MDGALADRIRGVLYGQAVGDALGLGTEFLSKPQVLALYPQGLRAYAQIVRDQHRSHWTPGDWTDDTEQMLCILASLVERRALDERDVAARLQVWALAGGMGMGETVASVLCDASYLRDPPAVARRVWEESARRSAANGAVMRTCVLGLWQHDDPARVEENAVRVCRLTHYDPRCVASCVAVCLLIAGLLEGRHPLEALLARSAAAAERHDGGVRVPFERAADGSLEALDLDQGLSESEPNRIGYTYTALEAGLWALMHAPSFEEGVLRIVHEGGDADSNAAVAGALLGAREGFARIPSQWVQELERGAEPSAEVGRFLDLLEYGAEPDTAIGTPQAYQYALEAIARRAAEIPAGAELLSDLERVVRYEIEQRLPERERLRARLFAPPRKPAGRIALVSDIHGNHAGLAAVLADIDTQGCERIVCLGDLVEGGTENARVIDTLRARGVPCVRGNHDEHNDVALSPADRRFLLALPERIVEDDVLFVHISPRQKKRKVNHAVEAWNVFDESAFRLVFIGHVHVPMIFAQRSTSFGEAALQSFEYNTPFTLAPEERYIVSIGAVGYGRDAVGKVRYAIYDATAGTLELRAIDGPLLALDQTLGGSTIEFL